MAESALNILAVTGSLHKSSVTRTVVLHTAGLLRDAGCSVDILDCAAQPLQLFNPDSAWTTPEYLALKPRVHHADVFLLGTPDYHGSISSTLKNFLDHFWKEFAGKLFGTVVASHEKGLTVTDQLRTVARQCYAWSMPYGISFAEKQDVTGDQIVNDAFKERLAMYARDLRVYGEVLTRQRRADLAGTDHGFLARHRPQK